MIKQIETFRLVAHPKNPRLQHGDLTELKDSIAANGIFQNLTVVQTETVGIYTIIIGHRRHAAAILAGLETVPCVVVEMDEKKQQATMLLENMQRSDLTPYEEAQGIQMCLDLGMTEKDGYIKIYEDRVRSEAIFEILGLSLDTALKRYAAKKGGQVNEK